MAETAVNFVIDNLAPLLKEEARLLGGIHKEAESIKAELEIIRPFLRAADERIQRGEVDDGVKAWVKQVRKVSYQIEDVIDEYMLQNTQQQPPRLVGFLRKIACCIKDLKERHGVASQIQEIKGDLREIKERGNAYGFSSIEQLPSSGRSGRWLDPRLDSLFIEEAKVVGIEVPRDKLISQLVKGPLNRVVVSVVGMAGLGKTTLVKKVYDHQSVSKHFICRAWIPVSQTYEKDEILRKLIKELCHSKKEPVPEGVDSMDDRALISSLRDYLDDERYLVVLDDVWDTEFWGFIKLALPNKDDKGSRVLITTRSEKVASSCKESPSDDIYKHEPLPSDKAWELFCSKTFQSDFGGVCPPHLEALSRDIVKKCGGVPLAIVAMGGILATKQKVAPQWQRFLRSVSSELGSDARLSATKRILSLSYFDLPYYLKLCYLYFGILPEDYSISCARLVRLWIAEGFVKGVAGKTVEEVAEEYLHELIERSLVQVSAVNFDGEVKTCQVHDLMREVILLMSADLSFSWISGDPDSATDGQARRLSIQNSENNVLNGIAESKARSVFWFDEDESPNLFISRVSATFRLLKILDFEDAQLNHLPQGVGDLFHLRYLSVKNTDVKDIPKSIGKLQNLLTLNLKDTLVTVLPVEMKRLHKLRHLLAYRYDESIEARHDPRQGVIMEGVGSLEAIQKLSFVKADGDIIKELRKLRQLRKLGIKKLRKEDGKSLCATIELMTNLESLDITTTNADEILDLQHISSPPRFLRRLYLQGRLEKFPDWMSTSNLQSVARIGLYFSGFTEGPLKFLKDLPNLLELRLYGAYGGKSLCFEKGGFQKLKLVKLKHLNALESVIIEEPLPALEELQLGPIPQLKEVPSGIQHLRRLTTLRFYNMPDEFIHRIKPNVGQDYHIIQHIGTVLLHKSVGWKYETSTPHEYFAKNKGI